MGDVEQKKPAKEFLLMLIILLRKSEHEVGCSLVEFLEDFESEHPDLGIEFGEVDAYDDKQLRRALRKYCNLLYPPKDNPAIDIQDFAEDDKTAEEVLADDQPAPPPPGFTDDSDEPLPQFERLEE